MIIRPGIYTPTRRMMRARVVIAVTAGVVTYHPDGRPEAMTQQSEGDFATWAELGRVVWAA